MAKTRRLLGFCLVGLALLLGACGGDEEPAAAAPAESVAPEPAATATAPAPDAPEGLAHEFSPGTELLTFEESGFARNPVLTATEDGFRWGALVSREGRVAWVVDGVETTVGEGDVSDFAVSGDLSRHAYVSNDVVVVDGEPVAEGTTSCCPVFSRDGTAFGYIADGSFVVLDGAPQEAHAEAVSNLVLSDNGSGSAYVVGGDTVVVDGEKQAQYDSVSALTLSPEGSRFAYIGNDSILVVDGEELDIGETTAEQIAFSPDGSQLAYVMGALDSGKAVLDEKEQKKNPFGCVDRLLPWPCITFAANGESFVYVTKVLRLGSGAGGGMGTVYRVVRDNVQEKYFLVCCLVDSPEGSHLAYVSDGSGVVIDGRAVESTIVSIAEAGVMGATDAAGATALAGRIGADLVFSGDGGRLAFLMYVTDVNPTFITELYLEILDVP